MSTSPRTIARKATPLPPGGTVGVPATGWSRYDEVELHRARGWWEERGYRVKVADRVFHRRRYLGDRPERQALELTRMFADPEVDAIQCYDAGYGATRLLPHLDYGVIAEHLKPFIGYSDTTSLHTALRRRTRLVTFYGPLFSMLGSPGREPSEEWMLQALTTAGSLGTVPTGGRPVGSFNSGSATGELAGGCLWPIVQSIGTPWQVDLLGRILFFEDLGKPPHLIDEQLTHLRHAGLLDGVAGVAVGEMVGCDWTVIPDGGPRPMSVHEVFEEHLQPLGVPVVYDLPLGHGAQLITVPLGVSATVDADEGTLTLEEPALAG